MRRGELADLTAFIAVADNLSIRTAATRLGVTLSALSHTVRTTVPTSGRSFLLGLRRDADGGAALGRVQRQASHADRPTGVAHPEVGRDRRLRRRDSAACPHQRRGLRLCLGHSASASLSASLAPGKRPRTTLSPSFALRDGEPYMAFGTRPGHLAVETRFPKAVVDELARRGHDLEHRDGWSLGRVSAAAKGGPLLKAAANPRHMQGYAIGR